MGKLKNAVNQTKDLDNLTIRKVYHKLQNVTEPQGKQQPAAAASWETEDAWGGGGSAEKSLDSMLEPNGDGMHAGIKDPKGPTLSVKESMCSSTGRGT